MDGWKQTWATTGAVVFVGLFVEGLSWATATPPRPALDLWLVFGFATLGLVVFVFAMTNPKWLPFRKSAERQEADRLKREIQHEGKKYDAQRMRSFIDPFSTERGQREQTEAMNRLAEEMRLQREAKLPWTTGLERPEKLDEEPH